MRDTTTNFWHRIRRFFDSNLWSFDFAAMSRSNAFGLKILRFATVLLRDLDKGQLSLRAMSLVYTTLLSLVPLLAVSFSMLKAFGVHNMIEPTLLNFLSPLGDKGVEITDKIIVFVSNIKVGVLGSLGLAFLFYTVVALIQKIENAFNFIWKVQKSRRFSQRFSEYLSVIIVGPVLVFTAVGMTATLMNSDIMQSMKEIKVVGIVFLLAGKLVPYFFAIGAFTFAYTFIPNTKVFMRAALLGGSVAGVLWNTTGYGFAYFVVVSTNYTAIYSGFAILIIFIIWIYLSWLILLLGAQISFYHQRPDWIKREKGPTLLSSRERETLGLLLMFHVAKNFYYAKLPWTADGLARSLRIPLEVIQISLDMLLKQQLIVKLAARPSAYVPSVSIENIKLPDLLNAIRRAEERCGRSLPNVESAVAAVVQEIDAAVLARLAGRTLRDLVLSAAQPEPTICPEEIPKPAQ